MAANFMTRAQVHVTRRLAITYWHWSNVSLADRNPRGLRRRKRAAAVT